MHFKCRGLAHTLSATSLSEVALRRTCTESISGGSPHLKPHQQKKTKCALSTLGVIFFLICLPNYLITEDSHLRLCAARAQASRAPLPMPSMAHSSLPQGTQSATPCHPMPPLRPSSALSLRGSSQVGTSQLSRNIANTPYSATSTPKQARIFCLCVCGNSQYRCNRAPVRLFARENATPRAGVASL